MTAIPNVDSYWVLENQFAAGAYPSSPDENVGRLKIQSLLRAGITCFVDLTQHSDVYFPYKGMLTQEAEEYNLSVKRYSFPIVDYDIPGEEMMTDILNLIDQNLTAGKKVYLHCVGGVGRTGTVVGCYLVRHGLSGEAALQRIPELRRQTDTPWKSSPESDFQINFVKHWCVGQ